MKLTRKQLQAEERRIKKLRREGYSERFIKSWLVGWRKVNGSKT